MKSLGNLIAAILFAVVVVPSHAAPAPRPVQSFVAGSLDVSEVKKTMVVYAEYAGAEEITIALRKRIEELGYPMADSAEKATVVFKVVPVYVGKASERPKTGTYDGVSDRQGIGFLKFLLSASVGAAIGLEPSAVMSPDKTEAIVSYWVGSLRDAGVIDSIENAFKPTKKPQEAIVSRVELTVNGVLQTADVVSETFGKDIPSDMLARENLRQAIWFLD